MRRRFPGLRPGPLALAIGMALFAGAGHLRASVDRASFRIGTGPRVDVFRLLPLYRGTRATVTLEGPSVDRSESVEPGPGATVPGGSVQRAPGRLTFDVVTDATAPLGARDLRLRYALELAGPERFPARVLRSGVVEAVEPRHVRAGRPVVLTFSGRDIGNADVLASNAYQRARVLPEDGEGRCQVEIVFVKEGPVRVALYDRDGPPRPADSLQELGGYEVQREAIVEVGPRGEAP